MDPAALERRLIGEMRLVFGEDEGRIRHALAVLDHAKALLAEEGGNAGVVIAAAILHDIGIREAERRHGSSAGRFQELEGPPIARRILLKAGMDEASLDHVCRIVGSHHSARDIDTPEFRILWDADWLVNLPEEHPGRERLLAERVLRTGAGRKRAAAIFL